MIQLWTDGGCWPNPGRGGFGYVIVTKHERIEGFGGELQTTNNRMEYRAALEGLARLNDYEWVTVYTDSQLLVNTASDWMFKWEKKDFLRKVKKKVEPVKNVDLVKRLLAESRRLNIRWEWVKGHAGIELNERADQLATIGMQFQDEST